MKDRTLKIDSQQNQRVKNAVKLRKKSARRKNGKTLVEGFREISRAFENDWKFEELYFCPSLYIEDRSPQLVEQIANSSVPVYECSEAVFKKMTYRDTPDGLIALSPLVKCSLEDVALPENPLLLITENLEKPGNLGTILRTADATGADAVIVCGEKTDINNPNVVRASMGTLFYIPVIEADSEEVIEWLKTNNIQVIAAFPDADLTYTNQCMKSPTAIVVGAEDQGLTTVWSDAATKRVSIPMLGKNDSLNVSTAAALLLYEAVRQRTT